ncbi:MAG: cytochrome c3 family protein [Planctomycetota bacterium]
MPTTRNDRRREGMHRLAGGALGALLVLTAWSTAGGQVRPGLASTKHNLLQGAPPLAKTPELCRPCHAPGAEPAPATGAFTGASAQCVACHKPMASMRSPKPDAASGHHPVSFVYDAALAARKGLTDPAKLPKILRLDKSGQLQCTSCHEPHDNTWGKFLVAPNGSSTLCRACHQMTGFPASSHARSTALLAGAKTDRWDNAQAPTVGQAACAACHRTHNAAEPKALLRQKTSSDTCMVCHDGSVAKDLTGDLMKFSTHPIALYAGRHEPGEDPERMRKHVDCVDCHNPHAIASAAGGATVTAPTIKPSMRGASGITGAGQFLPQANNEFEVCYKCHSGRNPVRMPLVARALPNTNIPELFSPINPSYHPVEAQGKASLVPSLLPPLRVASKIYCTDCHASDSRLGPRGPHGSTTTPMLVRRYVTTDYNSETPASYDLCYGCHDRSNILANRSFPLHKVHIVDVRAPCSVCHAAHGVSALQAAPANGAHLINFDRRIVRPAFNGQGPTYTSTGLMRGKCTLRCHNFTHINFPYAQFGP